MCTCICCPLQAVSVFFRTVAHMENKLVLMRPNLIFQSLVKGLEIHWWWIVLQYYTVLFQIHSSQWHRMSHQCERKEKKKQSESCSSVCVCVCDRMALWHHQTDTETFSVTVRDRLSVNHLTLQWLHSLHSYFSPRQFKHLVLLVDIYLLLVDTVSCASNTHKINITSTVYM